VGWPENMASQLRHCGLKHHIFLIFCFVLFAIIVFKGAHASLRSAVSRQNEDRKCSSFCFKTVFPNPIVAMKMAMPSIVSIYSSTLAPVPMQYQKSQTIPIRFIPPMIASSSNQTCQLKPKPQPRYTICWGNW
jgi:hypothetical protein